MSMAELKAELDRILKRLERDPTVHLVLLFGSLARDDARSSSDIDLIVVKETEKSFLTAWTSSTRMQERPWMSWSTPPRSSRR